MVTSEMVSDKATKHFFNQPKKNLMCALTSRGVRLLGIFFIFFVAF